MENKVEWKRHAKVKQKGKIHIGNKKKKTEWKNKRSEWLQVIKRDGNWYSLM